MSHEGMIESTGRRAFNLAMMLAFHARPTATHLLVDKDNDCIVFFWHEPQSHEPWKPEKLRIPMSLPKAIDYAWDWLQRELRTDQTSRRVFQGDMFHAGFRVKFGGEFRFYWKQEHKHRPEDGSPYAICAVYPVWHEMHK